MRRPSETIHTSFRLTVPQRRKIEALAVANDTTMGWIVGRLIDDAHQITPALFIGRALGTTEERASYETNADRGAVDSDPQHAAAAS